VKTLLLATWAFPCLCAGQQLAMAPLQSEYRSQEKKISVFENPENHFTRVEFEAPVNEQVTVDFINATGKLIERIYKFTNNKDDQFVELDTRYFAPGVYFVKVGEQMEKLVFY
jgi:hypothetical protein